MGQGELEKMDERMALNAVRKGRDLHEKLESNNIAGLSKLLSSTFSLLVSCSFSIIFLSHSLVVGWV